MIETQKKKKNATWLVVSSGKKNGGSIPPSLTTCHVVGCNKNCIIFCSPNIVLTSNQNKLLFFLFSFFIGVQGNIKFFI